MKQFNYAQFAWILLDCDRGPPVPRFEFFSLSVIFAIIPSIFSARARQLAQRNCQLETGSEKEA